VRSRKLSGLPYRIVGTAASASIERQRLTMYLDWVARWAMPTGLLGTTSYKHQAYANAAMVMKKLKPITDKASATAALDALREHEFGDDGSLTRALECYTLGQVNVCRINLVESIDWAFDWSKGKDRTNGRRIVNSALKLIDRMISLTEIHEPSIEELASRKAVTITTEQPHDDDTSRACDHQLGRTADLPPQRIGCGY
jgi:hypothetical protein